MSDQTAVSWTERLAGYPSFARELAGTVSAHSQFVLHGNIRDLYLAPPDPAAPPQGQGRGPARRPLSMREVMWQVLAPSGYASLVCYDPVDVLGVYPEEEAARRAAEALLGERALRRKPSLGRLRANLARVVGSPEPPPLEGEAPQAEGTPSGATTATGGEGAPLAVAHPRAAFILDYAARITRVPGNLDELERDFFLFCHKLAVTAQPRPGDPPGRAPLFNPVIWLVEGERDLPAWLTAGVDRIRSIAVPLPTLEERRTAAALWAPVILKRRVTAEEEQGDDFASYVREFANRTDGMTLSSMREITKLANDRGLGLRDISDAVRIYQLGVADNPWRRSSVRSQVQEGEERIRDEVLGQPRAIKKTLNILKRAAVGLSGAQAGSSSARPRGVLFFAGPTGVGKTELAKQVAGILFGDHNAYLRFDMSEFSHDHSADRLVGAPPGYVGFEAGGELTGAVRRNPFRVVLFDEIEKADPKVLDKFLQILEDGRLTDGQGVTTHFSECVLIFTSNLGIYLWNEVTKKYDIENVDRTMDYPTIESKIEEAIREHFNTKINRPELLNRLGDNIVVFGFVDDETAAKIFQLMLGRILERCRREQDIEVTLDPAAEADLRALCTANLDHGGRGIGNQLESNLINPLARYLFDHDVRGGACLDITAVTPAADGVGADLAIKERDQLREGG